MAIMRGCGRPSLTVWSNVLSCIIVGYPLAFSLTFAAGGGLLGLWGAMSTAWFTATLVYVVCIAKMNWEREASNARERSVEKGEKDVVETKL